MEIKKEQEISQGNSIRAKPGNRKAKPIELCIPYAKDA